MATRTKKATVERREREVRQQASYEWMMSALRARKRYKTAAAGVTNPDKDIEDWLCELVEDEVRSDMEVQSCIERLPWEMQAAAKWKFLYGEKVRAGVLKRIVREAEPLVPEYFVTRIRRKWLQREAAGGCDFDEIEGWCDFE